MHSCGLNEMANDLGGIHLHLLGELNKLASLTAAEKQREPVALDSAVPLCRLVKRRWLGIAFHVPWYSTSKERDRSDR